MPSFEFAGNADGQRIAAANSAQAKEIKLPVSEPASGEAAKIRFRSPFCLMRRLQPLVVDAIEVHNLRLKALFFQDGGKAEDADRRKLAHDASCIHFAHGPVTQLVGRGRTNETNFHGSLLNCES